MIPAPLKSCSDGTVVAGAAKNRRDIVANFGYVSQFSFHHEVGIPNIFIMEHYVKGEENSVDLVPPFPEELILKMPVLQIKVVVRLQNLVAHAGRLLSDTSNDGLILSGVGPACSKVISCVEMLKRRFEQELFQVTKICYKRIEEFWEPMESNLDRLKVNKDIPAIFILVSKQEISLDDTSCQKTSETTSSFFDQKSYVDELTRPMSPKSKQNLKDSQKNLWQRKRKTFSNNKNEKQRPQKNKQ